MTERLLNFDTWSLNAPSLVRVGAAPGPLQLQLDLSHARLVLNWLRVLGADVLHHASRLGRVLALGTNPFAITIEEEGEGDARYGQEGWNRAGPVDAEVLVHVGREQREDSAKERTEHRVGGQDRGGVDEV